MPYPRLESLIADARARASAAPPTIALVYPCDELAIDAAIRQGARLFGVSPVRARRLRIASHFHDWSSDPFSRGAYSYQAVGGAGSPDALARPVKGTLFFAGEASSSDASGTVPGAIATGRHAARQALR